MCSRVFGQLLVCLTALLMVLSPLQVTAISFSGTIETQVNLIQNPATLAEDPVIFSDFALNQFCDICKVDQCCFSYSCSSGQCSTCTMLLSPSYLTSMISFARPVMRQTDEGILRLFSDSLFRPPKNNP